ncbi:MAG: DAK2 domain-containing protein [Clostridia bacterium]|nr:DAK2 domain-containing protein [Clostridia bacterium]
MKIYSFNGKDLYAMLVGSTNRLAKRKAEIDALNVFPVPDGDTGTNMYYTMLAGAREAARQLDENIGRVAEAAASGSLLGARGNSGVILSQFIAGLGEAMAGLEQASLSDVARGLQRGVELACQAIANPVEGTIITVGREMAAAFSEAAGRSGDLVRATVLAYQQAQKALEKTPELLPVLKEAGVVDAGGRGLVVILEGIIKALKDAAASRDVELFDVAAQQQRQFASTSAEYLDKKLQYTYCTEFILSGSQIPHDTLRQELAPYGDCLMVVGNKQTVKVHIHTNHPGLVMECGLRYGALKEIHINNMEEQMQEQNGLSAPAERPLKKVGLVAVGLGEGINIIMNSLGVDRIVQGGQTMNPSAQDLLAAVEATPAETVILLPNNKNVILAAEQARSLASKEVMVLPSRSLVQGISALLAFNTYEDGETNYKRMEAALAACRDGEVTVAVRDSSVNGISVRKGEYMALTGDGLVAAAANLEEAVAGLVGHLSGGKPGLVTLYFGADMAEAEARWVLEKVQAVYPRADIELYYGGQPVYHFLVSVE